LRTYGSLVTFSHTLFALPFAAAALCLVHAEPHAPIGPGRILAIVACLVAARTSAMAYNRYLDRDIDSSNPRTRGRHIPSGSVSPREALALTALSAVVFLGAACSLGFLPGLLALPVLAVLLGYSWSKRFTWASHAWLGVALALAPGGVWVAVGARPGLGIVALMAGVVSWLFGFDILYSLQDVAFDCDHGLHSFPSRFGVGCALVASAVAHAVTVVLLGLTGAVLHRGFLYQAAVILTAALLLYEHVLVGRGNLARIDKAFFDVNAYVSVGFFLLVLADEILRCRA
jgi:4-hydroxybenzoate polyprenyltransferase